MKPNRGEIRVGRRIYDRGGKYVDPTFPGFTPIICLTKSTAYGSLGPYELVNEDGVIMENWYQFSRIFASVPAAREYKSRYDRTVIWEHPAEEHVRVEEIRKEDGTVEKLYHVQPAYLRWREKGMKSKHAIRYPVGFGNQKNCLFAFAEKDGKIIKEPLDYIQGRKKIYVPEYTRLVKQKPQFQELKQRLERGERILIIEVDACHQESLDYYKEKYGVGDDFIVGNTMLATEKNLSIMLNDPRHSYGHCYCLAAALLDLSVE